MSQADDKEMMAQVKAEEESLERFKCLFDGLQFFLSREVPREALAFIIRWGIITTEMVCFHVGSSCSRVWQYCTAVCVYVVWVGGCCEFKDESVLGVFCSRYICTDAVLQVRMYIVVIVLAVVPLLLQELWGDGVLGHRVRSWLHLL